MENKATVKLVYDPRVERARVRVTFNRQPRLYSTLCNQTLTRDEFDNGKLKKTKMVLAESESAIETAQHVCDELGGSFTFTTFTKLYRERLYGDKMTASNQFKDVAEQYISNNLSTPGSKSAYRTAANWVLRYNANILLSEIDAADIVAFIKKTSKEDNGKDLSENSVRMYLRSLKAIYNSAIRNGAAKGPNPFANIKGQPLSSIRREKGALDDDELAKFISYQPVNDVEQFGYDMFILSLQLSGANIGDILSLKNRNIVGDEVRFIRRKTRKSNMVITIPLTSTAREILCKHGIVNRNAPDEYILPFLSHCDTETRIRNKIHDITRKANDGIKGICRNTGISDIRTYNARHTYAVLAQDSNMSAEQIQKFLGHTSSRTTEIYLGSITTKMRNKNRDMLEDIMRKTPM